MGIKNEEVMVLVKDKFKSMQDHINTMEKELLKDSDENFNRPKTAASLGKVVKLYEDIAYLMGIYDNVPKYEGR